MTSTAIVPTLTLRPVVPADDAFLRRLYASTRAAELEIVAWSAAEKADFINMQFAAQSRHYAQAYAGASFDVVEIDGAPAGRLYLSSSPTEMRIIDIALLPQHCGHGIGTGLLQDILGTARMSGRTVSIHVELENPARRLYERLGFVAIEQRGLHTFMEWKG